MQTKARTLAEGQSAMETIKKLSTQPRRSTEEEGVNNDNDNVSSEGGGGGGGGSQAGTDLNDRIKQLRDLVNSSAAPPPATRSSRSSSREVLTSTTTSASSIPPSKGTSAASAAMEAIAAARERREKRASSAPRSRGGGGVLPPSSSTNASSFGSLPVGRNSMERRAMGDDTSSSSSSTRVTDLSNLPASSSITSFVMDYRESQFPTNGAGGGMRGVLAAQRRHTSRNKVDNDDTCSESSFGSVMDERTLSESPQVIALKHKFFASWFNDLARGSLSVRLTADNLVQQASDARVLLQLLESLMNQS
jgi:hypothetical protein